MKKCFTCSQEHIDFHLNQQKIFTLNLKELLGFSDSFPWELQYLNPRNVSTDKDRIKIEYADSKRQITAEATICEEDGLVRMDVSFKNASPHVWRNAVMQTGIGLYGIQQENSTIPHNIYNDNPSADPSRLVPHVKQGIIVEEHRLPIPAVNVEWVQDEAAYFATLFSIPDIQDCEDDKYWSLGVLRVQDGIRIQALSGPTMFNGIKDMVYAGKNAPVPFERGYKVLLPGQAFQKTFYIDYGTTAKGRGFQAMVSSGYTLLKPKNTPKLPLKEVLSLKTHCLDSRYYEDADTCGYLTFGDANSFGNKSGRPEYFLYGWTGQANKLAWCDIQMGVENKDPQRLNRALRSVDFYVRHGENPDVSGMRAGYYLIKERRFMGAGWNDSEHYSSRIQGEAIYDLLDVMLLLRDNAMEVPREWEQAVHRACLFMMDETRLNEHGLYPLLWKRDGSPVQDGINSAGISCIIALAKAYEYFHERLFLTCAEKLLGRYYDLQLNDFKYPFCKATLDARCEDKEAGIYFFLAAFELYKITRKDCYKDWAGVSGSWILTFVYFWQTGFKIGSYPAQMEFSTVGWPGVSVQNHHLDVFFPCYELYEFGKMTGQALYEEMGKIVFSAFSHGICTQKGEWGFDVLGEQSEQFYPTNFFMSTYPELLEWVQEWRRGIRIWNPSWIIAQVLKSGLQFSQNQQILFEEKGCAGNDG